VPDTGSTLVLAVASLGVLALFKLRLSLRTKTKAALVALVLLTAANAQADTLTFSGVITDVTNVGYDFVPTKPGDTLFGQSGF
jgi:VPDSG-CTERM exosortase interaction domain